MSRRGHVASRVMSVVTWLLTAMITLGSGDVVGKTSTVEVHAISLYKAKYGQVDVQVSVIGRPVVLFLSAYNAVEWVIHADRNVTIEKVVVSGYQDSVVKGLPSSVAVLTLPKQRDLPTYFMDGSWQGGIGTTYRNVWAIAKSYLGLPITTFQGGDSGESFVIDGKRSILYPADVLEGVPETGSSLPSLPRQVPHASSGSVASGYGAGQQGKRPSNRPIVTGSGPINSETIEKYKTIAVFPIKDAPGASGSGATASGMFMGELAARGFTVVDRTQLDRLFEEQRLQLTYADEQKLTLKVGRLAGASAILVGEASQWLNAFQIYTQGMHSRSLGHVALSVRLIDAESGVVLFNGEAQYPEPVIGSPQTVGQTLVRLVTSRLAQKAGLEGSGRIGVTWDLQSTLGGSLYVIREFESDSPALEAGLRTGDILLSCNGSTSVRWKTYWDSLRHCRGEVGQALNMQVLRNDNTLSFSIKVRDSYAPSPR